MPTHDMNRMIIFDDGLSQLGVMTDLRAAFEVRTGMYTTAARIAAHHPKTLAGYWVPEHLAAVVASRANAPVNTLPEEEIIYCVSGRWALPDPNLQLKVGEVAVEEASGHVVAALLRRADAEYFLTTGQLHERAHLRRMAQRVLYKYPWDIIARYQQTIPHDIASVRMLAARVPRHGVSIIGDNPVEVHQSAAVSPGVVYDAQNGPIVVHENAVVRPNCVLPLNPN